MKQNGRDQSNRRGKKQGANETTEVLACHAPPAVDGDGEDDDDDDDKDDGGGDGSTRGLRNEYSIVSCSGGSQQRDSGSLVGGGLGEPRGLK